MFKTFGFLPNCVTGSFNFFPFVRSFLWESASRESRSNVRNSGEFKWAFWRIWMTLLTNTFMADDSFLRCLNHRANNLKDLCRVSLAFWHLQCRHCFQRCYQSWRLHKAREIDGGEVFDTLVSFALISQGFFLKDRLLKTNPFHTTPRKKWTSLNPISGQYYTDALDEFWILSTHINQSKTSNKDNFRQTTTIFEGKINDNHQQIF